MFPLSETEKENTRIGAANASLSVADKAESQEICFIPDGDYAKYIEDRMGACPAGDFIDETGKVLGRHNGIIRYTVGQRKGLGIALGVRSFVSNIDPVNNTVTLTASLSERDELSVRDIVLSGAARIVDGAEYKVRLRYQAKPLLCKVYNAAEGRVKVILEDKARVITAGQSAVFYDNDVVAFGGFIE
jgi:tRNA-specific 2-thiouridylase